MYKVIKLCEAPMLTFTMITNVRLESTYSAGEGTIDYRVRTPTELQLYYSLWYPQSIQLNEQMNSVDGQPNHHDRYLILAANGLK